MPIKFRPDPVNAMSFMEDYKIENIKVVSEDSNVYEIKELLRLFEERMLEMINGSLENIDDMIDESINAIYDMSDIKNQKIN